MILHVVTTMKLGLALVVTLTWTSAARADDPDYSYYEHEALGPLHVGMSEAEAIKALGKPKTRSKPFDEPATATWVTDWSWPDAALQMYATAKTGPWTARSVSITGKSKLATKRGIHLGSTRADVEHAYPRAPDDPGAPDRYLVGSSYGGMLFFFDAGKVVGIDIGVFAF
jgi:hypothetical protein